jgi:hypothetical protein
MTKAKEQKGVREEIQEKRRGGRNKGGGSGGENRRGGRQERNRGKGREVRG